MDVIYSWSIWIIVAALVGLSIIANVIGYRIGLASKEDESERAHYVNGAIKASILGLVALLLGFTYSMTSSRYDERQHIVMNEANAVGTCYLRAGLLAPPATARIRATLQRYTDLRLSLFENNLDREAVQQTSSQMDKQLNELWSAIEASAKLEPEMTRNSYIVWAANDVIDMSSKRAWAANYHVPSSVIFLLGGCMIISGALTGHSSGRVGRAATALWITQILVVALVLYVVLDFDHPSRGLIEVNNQPFVELRKGMKG